MTQRFYLPIAAGAAAAINIGGAVSGPGLWEKVEGTITTRKLVLSKTGYSDATTATVSTVGNGTSPNDTLMGSYLTDALAAQTISGFFKSCCRGKESNSGANANWQVGVYVVNSAGAWQSTLYAGTSGSSDEFSAVNNWARPIPGGAGVNGVTMTSRSCSANDRVLVEIGVRLTTTNTTHTASAFFGANSANGDCVYPDDSADVLNGWVEFATDLVFAGGGGGSRSVAAVAMG